MSLKHKMLVLLIPVITACVPQVDSTYNGAPLVQLTGTVQNTRTLGVADAEVAIVWHNTSGTPDLAGGGSVPVQGSFPANFRLSLYLPPDNTLINSFSDGSRVGIAYIFAGKTGTDYESKEVETNILGMDPDHLLVYLPQEVAAGSLVATLLRGTPRPGFHIYNVHHLTEAESQARAACKAQLPAGAPIQQVYATCGGSPIFDDLLPASADLETVLKVDLVDDLDQLTFPNWT